MDIKNANENRNTYRRNAQAFARYSAGGGDGDRLSSFAAVKAISPFITKDLASMMTTPIKFQAPTGGTAAYGYEATILADICDAVLSARKAGALDKLANAYCYTLVKLLLYEDDRRSDKSAEKAMRQIFNKTKGISGLSTDQKNQLDALAVLIAYPSEKS